MVDAAVAAVAVVAVVAVVAGGCVGGAVAAVC